MKIIQRYLVTQFIRIFVMTFFCLLGVYIIADFVGNVGEFVDYGKGDASLTSFLVRYYGARVPWFFDIASRNVAVLSAALTLAWMKRSQELTAVMAAGISRWRVARPLVIVSVGIAILSAVNRELWVPSFRTELCRNAQDLIRDHPEKLTPRYDPQTDILIDGLAILQREKKISEPRFRLPTEWQSAGRRVDGRTATFQEGTPQRPSGYLITDVRHPDPQSLPELPSLIVYNHPVVLTSRDHPWLNADELFVVSNISVDQLRRGRQWQRLTATKPLIDGLQNGSIDHAPDVRVMIHSRLVQPLLDVTLIFLGLPIVLKDSSSRKVVLQAAKSLLAVVFFASVVIICHGMGIQGMIQPSLAAWLPLIILVPVAILLSEPLRR